MSKTCCSHDDSDAHLSQGLSIESVEDADFQSESNQLISTGSIILWTQTMHDYGAKKLKITIQFVLFDSHNICNLMIPCSIIPSHNSHICDPFLFMGTRHINLNSFIFNFMNRKKEYISEALFTTTTWEQSLVSKHANWQLTVGCHWSRRMQEVYIQC